MRAVGVAPLPELPSMLETLPILKWALPAVIALSLIEALVLSRRARRAGPAAGEAYDWKALAVSLGDQAGRVLLRFVPLSIATPVFAWVWPHRLFTIDLDGWQAFAVLFVGQEFFYYWYHRAAHRVRWFWATHVVHHSPNQLNLSAAYRLGWTGQLTGTTLFFTPLVWLGFEPRAVLSTLAVNLLYQFWIHATWIPRLGPLEWVLNTPSAHRVHHAANLAYLDANYGGVLIVFDRLFGTYLPERADEPCRYGLVRPIEGYRLMQIEFGQWAALARDLWHARSLRAMLGLLVKPPGWSPDGPGETTEALRARAAG